MPLKHEAGDKKMAAVSRGVVTALQVYVLLVSLLKSVDFCPPSPDLYKSDKLSYATDPLIQQVNHTNKHFGYGRSKFQQSDALISVICLLLSGDIHPCPGPVCTDRKELCFSISTVEVGTSTSGSTARSNAILPQVQTFVSVSVTSDHEQNNLISRICHPRAVENSESVQHH